MRYIEIWKLQSSSAIVKCAYRKMGHVNRYETNEEIDVQAPTHKQNSTNRKSNEYAGETLKEGSSCVGFLPASGIFELCGA